MDRLRTASLTITLVAALLAVPVCAEGSPDASATSSPNGSDWPRFLGPTADGRSPETGLAPSRIADGLSLVWQLEAGEGYATPVVADGRLFHFDRVGDKARLLCLNARTGEELWRSEYTTDYEDYYDYSNGPRAAPLVDGDRVYVHGVEGRLRAHSVTDGKLLWEVDTVERFGVVKNFFGVGSSPVVEGDNLIVMIGGSPPDSPPIHSREVKGNGTGIVAFDKRSGEIVYQLTDELASYSMPVLTTIGDRRWGFAFTRGGLVGFEPRTGKQDFFFPWRARILESVNAATPIVDGDTVFISETYGPGSAWLKVRPGGYELLRSEEKTRDKSLELHWNTPVLHDGVLYGSSGRNSGDSELRAVDFASGEVLWRRPGLKRANLLYVDGHLLVLGEYGELVLIEATPEAYRQVADLTPKDAAGKPLLRFPAWGPPVLSHGLLYLRGKDNLLAMELIPGG